MAAPSSCITHAPTEANKANLAVSFLEEVRRRYAGTRLERQELDGLLVEDLENALWTDVVLKAVQVKQAPELDRIVVAIDPPMTGHKASNACGIIVAGLRAKGPEQSWKAYVLCDATITGSSPSAWANIAVKAFHQWGAQRVIA
jgi:phage terminase large subunit-like protein